MLPSELFISHSSADHDFVTRLVRVLRGHNVPLWYSSTNIQGAQQWHDEIGAALTRCDWFLLVLSPRAVASRWVKRELMFALQQDRFESRIVPVVYQACDVNQLSWVLSSVQMIDFEPDFDNGCRGLMRLWGYGYDPSKA
ncbi:MAG: toll/interleukin-1 receptor domain-containing protein [Capsulimonadaceae bacterium]